MPLDPEKLAKALNDLFSGVPAFPADADKAGDEWAKIYREYAADAVAGPTAPVGVALKPAAAILAKALAGAFTLATAAGPGGLAVVVLAMDTAFRAFWATPIPFAPPLPAPPAIAGVVTAPASGSLASLMSAALAAGLLPGATELQGTAVAVALDSWTKTVSVVNTPVTPPGPSLPPVNLL